MFKGTEKYSPEQYNEVIQRMGGSSNAFTTNDFTCFYTVFSKEDLPAVIAMEADRFQNLKYSDADFKTEPWPYSANTIRTPPARSPS